MKPLSFLILHLKLGMDSTDIVSHLFSIPFPIMMIYEPLDWAYLEDWCRRLTGSFRDVYVFTIPLYLPRQEVDGKWRVVSPHSNDPKVTL